MGKLWPFDCQDARKDDTRIAESVGDSQVAWYFRRQFEARRSDSCDDHLRAGIEGSAGVVECVDCGFRLEMEVASPVGAHQDVAEERGDVVQVESWVVGVVGDQQEFRERKLALAEDRIGLREQFLWSLG